MVELIDPFFEIIASNEIDVRTDALDRADRDRRIDFKPEKFNCVVDQHFEVTVDRPGAVQRCEFLLQIRFEVSNLLSGEIFNLDVSESRLNVQIIFVRPATDRFLFELLVPDVVFEYLVKRDIIGK